MAKYNKKEGVVILVGLENDPRIPITEVMKAGYFIEDDQFHPLMNEWKVIIRRSSDNSIVTEEEVFDALAPKPVAVASTASATNGNKADPFGPPMPTSSIPAIPNLGSTRVPNKPATPNIGIPKFGVSLPAAAQPAQQTAAAAPPPPQPKVEVDYRRIEQIIDQAVAARLKPISTSLENVVTEADLASATEGIDNTRDQIANMISNHFRPANGDDPGGSMTVLIQDVNFLKKRVKADEQSSHDEGYQEGIKDAETQKFWVSLYSIFGITIVVLLAGFFVLAMI